MSEPSGEGGHPLTQRSRRVLVVDDERPLVQLVVGYLERDGFEVSAAHDGATALEVARTVDPDVVVLDLGLPVLDGMEVCRRLRTFSDCYVVMLTARADEVDKLVGLSVGADDYVTKPFSPRELVARIHVMLRRPRESADQTQSPQEQAPHVLGGMVIDVAGHEVHLDGEPVPLTRTEFDLLAALAARPKLAFTRRQLIEAVWGDSWVGDEHVVDVHIAHLRRKLGDDAGAPRFVRTVRGVGYRLGTGS